MSIRTTFEFATRPGQQVSFALLGIVIRARDIVIVAAAFHLVIRVSVEMLRIDFSQIIRAAAAGEGRRMTDGTRSREYIKA